MAESESGQEKTEQPTEKRLKDSRQKGDSPRSAELATASVFLAALGAIMAFGSWMTGSALDWMRNQLESAGEGRGLGPELLLRAELSFGELLLVATPVMAACLIASFIAPIALGFNFSTEALAPKLERLSPLAGMKRIWGVQGLGELVKSLLRIVILGLISATYYYFYEDELLQLINLQPAAGAAQGFSLVIGLLVSMGIGLGLLAVADVPFQLWSWKRRLKMTRQELLEEMKEMEGRPEVKAHIRRMQQEASGRRMMDAVPAADVVVVNPTHYAVALKYEGGKNRAPIVVAKGVDEMALNIRKIADAHKVAIVSAPPLARVLYAQGELDREIPVKLYQAVAQVLSYVYQLKVWTPKRGKYPTLPDFDDLERPEADEG
jgi:flagellar biosynthetic protein FlhB